ncbi:MAG: Multi-sensor signal transduction histidine kinase [Candidatus Falkowbacteria bacterium GW2011_GWA2_41_14]|uniref:histidine kinase n=1 Tax=Candidatus Falkowbacteria bacterium GW2011_GWA2_41_14 TaxID=1618635 RepID=A0A0G0URM3_9BACT|nr:MAG: Multi-sensor signal transduction histidine kinase [Candidatus Falkowbacteria bacterium GW2011_GWA2_41_14]
MVKIDKKKIGIIAGVLAFVALTNGALIYLYPENFSVFAYMMFIFVPLIVIVLFVFAKFSLLFLKRIDEEEDEGDLLRERQKEIVENMLEGLVVHDSNNKIISVNGVAERFLNTKSSYIKGKKINEVDSPSGLLRAIFAPMEDKEEAELSFKGDVGQDLFYQVIHISLNKERGEFLKIIRDVTRAKYLDRMKSEYITIMSHKILTPLTNIKWAAGVLSEYGAGEPKIQSSVKNITDNANELIEFTSHLLNITEIEEGLFGYKFEKVDMGDLAQEAIKRYQRESLQRNIKILAKEAQANIYFVNGDKNRLETAITNYIDNAIKYSPNGGQIEISLHQDKYTLWFSVKDGGVGVSPEAIESLFTKFFRDKRAKAVHTEGTGVGLFIVKNIIEKHSGKVGYDPIKRGGSMFYFTLPVYKENK